MSISLDLTCFCGPVFQCCQKRQTQETSVRQSASSNMVSKCASQSLHSGVSDDGRSYFSTNYDRISRNHVKTSITRCFLAWNSQSLEDVVSFQLELWTYFARATCWRFVFYFSNIPLCKRCAGMKQAGPLLQILFCVSWNVASPQKHSITTWKLWYKIKHSLMSFCISCFFGSENCIWTQNDVNIFLCCEVSQNNE